MDTAKQFECHTIDEIYALPDGQRAELIDGELYMMASPGTKHQRLVGHLFFEITDYIRKSNGDCEVFPSPFAVFLNANSEIYVEPDISIICDKDKITDEGCNGAPDWIIEVVSPSSRSLDYNKKLLKYGTAGVREYWIVDPDKNRVIVYSFEHGTVGDYTFTERVKAEIYEGLEIDFSLINIS